MDMLGFFIHQQKHGRGTGIRSALERAQFSHWPLLVVRSCLKSYKVSDDDGPTRSTTVVHVGGGDGTAMHGFRVVIP